MTARNERKRRINGSSRKACEAFHTVHTVVHVPEPVRFFLRMQDLRKLETSPLFQNVFKERVPGYSILTAWALEEGYMHLHSGKPPKRTKSVSKIPDIVWSHDGLTHVAQNETLTEMRGCRRDTTQAIVRIILQTMQPPFQPWAWLICRLLSYGMVWYGVTGNTPRWSHDHTTTSQ